MSRKLNLGDRALCSACAERPKGTLLGGRRTLNNEGAKARARQERLTHLRNKLRSALQRRLATSSLRTPVQRRTPPIILRTGLARLNHCSRMATRDLGFERLIRRKAVETTGTLRLGGPYPASLRVTAL